MLPIIWTANAVASEAFILDTNVWRIVDAQHINATMKLVDSLEEQTLLEQLLDNTKPAIPLDLEGYHYLLQTPFRYYPQRTGSRFRGINDLGVFYGAGTIKTAAAEIGYWRWRFLQESEGLKAIHGVSHSAFTIGIKGNTVDLRKLPFSKDKTWVHPSDYRETQKLAKITRETTIQVIQYQSVRDLKGWCLAVLKPQAFSSKQVDMTKIRNFSLSVTSKGAIWHGLEEAYEFIYS